MQAKNYSQFRKDLKNNELIGAYKDVPIREYHSSPGISQSSLKPLSFSLAHFIEDLGKDFKTRQMELGTKIHDFVLSPKDFKKNYVFLPTELIDVNKNSNRYKEFKNSVNKLILSPEDEVTLLAVERAISNCKSLNQFKKGSQEEISIYWVDSETDLLCKCRPDILSLASNGITDLKSINRRATADNISKLISDLEYDVQAAYYLDGVNSCFGTKIEDFFFAFAETIPPYGVRMFKLGYRSIEAAREFYKRKLRILKDYYDAKANNKNMRLGYPEGIIDVDVTIRRAMELEDAKSSPGPISPKKRKEISTATVILDKDIDDDEEDFI